MADFSDAVALMVSIATKTVDLPEIARRFENARAR
jgi:hypothetical protein